MRTMADGCRLHAVSEEAVEERWEAVNRIIDAALDGLEGDEREAEDAAQLSAVVVCHCCNGPGRDKVAVLCSACAGGDGCGVCEGLGL